MAFSWSTAGQYYIKTGKNFNLYSFCLNNTGKTKITFEVVESENVKNNNKKDCELVFGGTKKVYDEETGEVLEEIENFERKVNEIVLFFSYKKKEKSTKNDDEKTEKTK